MPLSLPRTWPLAAPRRATALPPISAYRASRHSRAVAGAHMSRAMVCRHLARHRADERQPAGGRRSNDVPPPMRDFRTRRPGILPQSTSFRIHPYAGVPAAAAAGGHWGYTSRTHAPARESFRSSRRRGPAALWAWGGGPSGARRGLPRRAQPIARTRDTFSKPGGGIRHPITEMIHRGIVPSFSFPQTGRFGKQDKASNGQCSERFGWHFLARRTLWRHSRAVLEVRALGAHDQAAGARPIALLMALTNVSLRRASR